MLVNKKIPAMPTLLKLNQNERPARPKLDCIIPMFNEAGNIIPLIKQLSHVLKQENIEYEFIVIDDGSTDMSIHNVLEYGQDFPISLVQLSRNFGKEIALTAGIQHSSGDVVLLIDADLQDPPEVIFQFLKHWRDGYDIVFALHPKSRDNEPWLKKIFTRVFYKIINIGINPKVPENSRDFRIMDKRVVDAIKALPERKRFMKGLYNWVGFTQLAIEVPVQKRQSGHSKFNASKLFSLALTAITTFSNVPLRLWMGIGALISLASIFYGIIVVFDALLFGTAPQGWPTLAAAISFLGGIQLLSIGMLGEYIGRIYDEAKQRPIYFITRVIQTKKRNQTL
jgi:glycosyltransferase involved in cell wall biosynthesis